MSRRAIAEDDEDGGLFDEESDEEQTKVKSKKRKGDSSNTKKKKKSKGSFIDDAAEESGEEGGGSDDEDEEDEDDDNNDYVRDGFVVDEDEEEEDDVGRGRDRRRKKKSGDLEDSDDDDDADDSDDDAGGQESNKGLKKKKAKKFRKVRELDRLADDDLDLIRDARGETEQERLDRLEDEHREAAKRKVVAHSGEELKKGLFYGSGEEDDVAAASSRKEKFQRRMVERYDEDGMDDFIDDDIGDQGEILASERRAAYEGPEGGGGVSEAQFNEASEIFGTEYLEYMQHDEQNFEEEDLIGRKKYRERGVGVDLGVDSESEDFDDDDDDDDDLFGDDDDEDGMEGGQKAEAMKLRREKRELARKERRQAKAKAKLDKRKARLRKAFEPIQLVENFCTDRDDRIRSKDVPERFFDWNIPFHGSTEGEISQEEEEEALWIMNQIPEIRSEYTAPTDTYEKMEEQEKSVVHSIAYALRFMHLEKLEPAFIKRYRQDIVTSPAVRQSLYAIMDQDAEWETMANAKAKVDAVLEGITRDMHNIDSAAAQVAAVTNLQEALAKAEQKLEETAVQETEIKSQLEAISSSEEEKTGGEDDDDDDEDGLFRDDDDDDDQVRTLHDFPIVFFLSLSRAFVLTMNTFRKRLPKRKRRTIC